MALQRRRRSSRSITTRPAPISGRPARPTGPTTSLRTPEAADFDDSAWETIEPAALETAPVQRPPRLQLVPHQDHAAARRSAASTSPARPWSSSWWSTTTPRSGWTGKLPLVLGQTGGQLIKGFNAPNRVVLTRDARPGQQIQLAVFGINGPVSNPPANFIWVRSATLDFYRPGQVGGAAVDARPRSCGSTPRSTASFPAARRLEKLAGGFQFIEGPVWHPGRLPALQRPQRQHDLSLDAGGLGLGLPHARAATPASTSASTTSPAPTGSRSTGRACSRSTSTATGG